MSTTITDRDKKLQFEANVNRIVSKVLNLPFHRWMKSKSDIYASGDSQAYESEYNRRTLSLIRKNDTKDTVLWYDGIMITEISESITGLYDSLESHYAQQLEDKRIEKIAELALLF